MVFSQENQYFSNNGSLTFETKDYNFNIFLVSSHREAREIWGEIWDNQDKNDNSNITPKTSVKIDRPISFAIVFTPIFTSKQRNVDLTYNLSILKANGVFSEKKYNRLIIYNGKVKKNIALHGSNLIATIFSNDDPIGKYQFHLDIYDSGKFLGKAILEFEVKE